jgi:sugar phosphate isomerase/epimerase
MYFSGIADEAGKDLATQIKAHQELGWSHIEPRTIDGVQFTDLSDDRFNEVRAALADAGLTVSCIAGPIANWASRITNPIENDLAILERNIPRMKQLGTQFIRVMSWPNDGLSDEDWRSRAISRMKQLTAMAEAGGVTLVLENCDGWASVSAENNGAFLSEVGSPALKAVYDTGNAASHGFLNTWEWYQASKAHIAYVHIKAHTGPQPDGSDGEHVYPDESEQSKVEETLTDLFASGYDGGISIEPHLDSVIHLGKEIDDSDSAYRSYIEYGQRTMKIVEKARAAAGIS